MNYTVGDRVMVVQFDTPYQCDLTGYYGHVTALGKDLVYVKLEGCIETAPDRHDRDQIVRDQDPYPLWPKELQHAD